MPVEQPEAQVELGQRAESQQIDLEEAEVLQVVLVPLDHRPIGHRGVLDRHQVVDRLVAEQEAARVDRQMARAVLDLLAQPEEVTVDRRVGVEPGVRQPRRVERAVMRQKPGEPIDRRLGQPERLAHLAHRRAPAVAHDVGHHGGAIAAVLAIDVLDHLLAAGVHDVEIDVRRLVPLARQEALEQQLDPRRIDGRDPQAVADHRVGGRAAPLAEDALLPAVPDDLPHRQEIAAVVELVDQRQLPVDLLADGQGHVVAEALARAAERELAQPRGRRLAVGQPFGGIAVADLGQAEGAARRHLAGPLDERRLVGEQLRHPLRRLQVVLGVRPDQPAGGGERDAVADAGQDVLQVAARRRVVQHLGGGDQGQAAAPGMAAQAGFPSHFLGASVPGCQRVQPVAERLAQRSGDRARLRVPDQQAPLAAPQRD